MKRIITILFVLVMTCSLAFTQEVLTGKDKREKNHNSDEIQTLFGRQRSNGGYGAFWMGYSMIDNKHALQFGGRGSWIIQHSFAIGFGGTGFINEYHYNVTLDKELFLTGGYGGLYLEPIVLPKLPVHLAFPVLIGAGGVSSVSYNDDNWGTNFVEDYEVFLIVEPGAEIEMNITRFMRLGLGATYRVPFSFNVGQPPSGSASAESIKGLSYNISFKFGSF